jgi:YD repeat-containing protein
VRTGTGGILFGWGVKTYAAEAENLTVMLGSLSVYKTERAYTTIKVGDPKVIDVDATSNRTLILNPTSPGSTNILFLDERGDLITSLDVAVSEPSRNRVRIIKSAVTKFYHCGATYCDLYEEQISKEPTPTPPTTSRTDSTSTTTYGRDEYGNSTATTRSINRQQ